jgi:hypothetical protein
LQNQLWMEAQGAFIGSQQMQQMMMLFLYNLLG